MAEVGTTNHSWERVFMGRNIEKNEVHSVNPVNYGSDNLAHFLHSN